MHLCFIIFTETVGVTDKTSLISDLSNEPAHPHPYLMPPTEKTKTFETH